MSQINTFNIKKILFLAVLLFTFSLASTGQSKFITITGKITSAKDNVPLIGVHVTYSDYRYGTVTNEEGLFQIKVSDNAIGDTLIFSFMGFANSKVLIDKELLKRKTLDVKLKAVTFGLSAIEVEDITAEEIIKRARDRIADNYLTTPHKIIGFYREENIQQDIKQSILFTEGVLEIKRSKLYKNRDYIDDKVGLLKGYKRNLPYQLIYQDSIYAITPISQGAYVPVLVDAIRSKYFLFNKNYFRFHNYERVGIDFIDNRVLYKIAFKPKRRSHFSIYEGILYIDKNTFAVVKADFHFTPHGIYLNEQSNSTNLKLKNRNFSAQYFEYDGHWYLEQASVRQVFMEEETQVPVSVKMDYVTTEVLPKERKLNAKQQLKFNDVMAESVGEVDANFWEDYIIIKK
ncbi:MAG: carboxypeptidase-like regulatory domain-containing protein [Bacteroidota bacterium]